MLRKPKVDGELGQLLEKHPLELLEMIHADPESSRAASAREVLSYRNYRISLWHNIVVLVLSAVVAMATLMQVYLAARNSRQNDEPASSHVSFGKGECSGSDGVGNKAGHGSEPRK